MRAWCGAICLIALSVVLSNQESNQERGASKQLAPGVPCAHLQTPTGVRTTIKAKAPFGAEMYRPNLFVANCRRLAGGQIALRASDILIIWPVEILFALISSASGALHRAQAAAARYGAGIAILTGGGDGFGKSILPAAERFMALREAAAAKASTVFPDAERKECRCQHGC
jgi:hypothetical protein